MKAPSRCPWCGTDPLSVRYHDEEWGVPSRDERHLFEMLILEGAQAGLSWITVLRRREGYRRAMAGFDPERLARFTARDEARLLDDAGIVRHRLKVAAAVGNARAYLALRASGRTLGETLWAHVGGRPVQNRLGSIAEAPATTPASDRMSRELKGLGFRFAGPTICYALMQATGMVNDHLVSCFRHDEVARLK